MKAIYLNVLEKKQPEIIEIEDNLKTYYKLINCKTIDIVTRSIENNYFSFVCDDEGLFVEKPITSAVDKKSKVQFVGNIIICGLPNCEGEMISLTDEECELILKNAFKVIDLRTRQIHYIIGNVEY